MKGLFPIIFLFHSFTQGVLGQSHLAAAIADLPSCALLCLESAVERSTCSATNTTCVCANAQLQSQVTLCVTETCTVMQGLTTKNITSNLCGSPIRDKGRQFIALSQSFGAISAAAIVLRAISKIVTGADFGLDDYSIFATFASGIPSSVISIHGLIFNGLGQDIWTLTPLHITGYLRAFYVMEIFYFFQVALLKLSLLYFYLRIFPGSKFRQILWATFIFNAAFGVSFVFGGIFQCQPISYYWNQWDGEHMGSCVNVNAMAWANAIISIILDAWMLGLAISQLVKLQMHWKKKVGVGIMFAVATFVTVVSILRLQSLLQFANSTNPTWDNLAVTQWSTVEINVGIICACMPSMRVLLVRLFPRLLGSTNRSTNNYYAQASRSQSRLGTNVSASRGKDLTTRTDQKIITYSQSFDVDLEDEAHLVPMKDMPTDYGKLRSQSSISVT